MPRPATDVPGTRLCDALQPLLLAARQDGGEAVGRLLITCRGFLTFIAEDRPDRGLQAKFDPADCVQEAIIKGLAGFAAFRGTTPPELLGWLRVILENVIRDQHKHYRGRSKRAAREVPMDDGKQFARMRDQLAAEMTPPDLKASKREEAADFARKLLPAITQLPSPYREVFTMRHQQLLSFAAIAAAVNRNEAAVRKIWLRALQRLRREFDIES